MRILNISKGTNKSWHCRLSLVQVVIEE